MQTGNDESDWTFVLFAAVLRGPSKASGFGPSIHLSSSTSWLLSQFARIEEGHVNEQTEPRPFAVY